METKVLYHKKFQNSTVCSVSISSGCIYVLLMPVCIQMRKVSHFTTMRLKFARICMIVGRVSNPKKKASEIMH